MADEIGIEYSVMDDLGRMILPPGSYESAYAWLVHMTETRPQIREAANRQRAQILGRQKPKETWQYTVWFETSTLGAAFDGGLQARTYFLAVRTVTPWEAVEPDAELIADLIRDVQNLT